MTDDTTPATKNPYRSPSAPFAPIPRPHFLAWVVLSLVALTSLSTAAHALLLFLNTRTPIPDIVQLAAGIQQIGFWILIPLIPLWTYFVHKPLKLLAPKPQNWKSGFSALAYFIPVANLFLVPATMREMINGYAAALRAGVITEADLNTPVPTVLRWWGCYIAANLSLLPGRLLHNAEVASLLEIPSSLLLSLSGYFFIRLIYRLSVSAARFRIGGTAHNCT